jgi:hypothetical protein
MAWPVGEPKRLSSADRIKLYHYPARYIRYIPDGGFDRNIQAFADAFIQLQEKRHAADYDPLIRLKRSDAILAIDAARTAVSRLNDASGEHRKAFLTLLLFPPRSAT